MSKYFGKKKSRLVQSSRDVVFACFNLGSISGLDTAIVKLSIVDV